MSTEGQTLDQKSLRYALGKNEDADGLACDCVGFSNAAGGTVLLGLEDGQNEPPANQQVADDFPDRLRKRLAQITVNVGVTVRKVIAGNGGEFVEVQVFRNEQSIAATSDGRYFIRVSDETRRLLPDDLGRLMAEKNSFVWELQTTKRVPSHAWDDGKLADFVKQVWNDYSLNPLELFEAVWREVPDWKEFYELPDGLFRKSVPHYDEVVVRELLANALAHRPYTQRGDIFLNLHPDRLEVHNAGLLPIGVTPRNILHTSSKRNPHLAKVFYDLKLMEGEGSGFDRMYEVLLTSGRPIPEVQQGDDRVVVTVRKQIVRATIVDLMVKADQTLQLNQKELITLGLLAQHEALTTIELVKTLELSRADREGDSAAEAPARVEAAAEGRRNWTAGNMATHGLPMDKEGLNQRVFVHSSCTKKGVLRRKAPFCRGLDMCKRRSTQATGFGQNNRLSVRQQWRAVGNVHENRPVHGDVNTALGVNESRSNHLFDGYVMADPKPRRRTTLRLCKTPKINAAVYLPGI